MRAPVFLFIAACLPSIGGAAEICPWLNTATAGGFLGGPVTSFTVKHAQMGADASCDFVRRNGAAVSGLRIEVETMHSPAKDFTAYAARCHAPSVPLRAIGNEAVACTDNGAELVVGRVRDRAFVVRITTNDRALRPGALRDKARQAAEQVAGILF